MLPSLGHLFYFYTNTSLCWQLTFVACTQGATRKARADPGDERINKKQVLKTAATNKQFYLSWIFLLIKIPN